MTAVWNPRLQAQEAWSRVGLEGGLYHCNGHGEWEPVGRPVGDARRLLKMQSRSSHWGAVG